MNTESTMHEAIKTFILNKQIKKEELLLTTQLVKEGDGGLNKLLIKSIEDSKKYSNENLKKITGLKQHKEEEPLDFHKKKHVALVLLAKTLSIDISNHQQNYCEQKQKILKDHQFATWLDNKCQYAEGVSVATHVAKLTHSSNKASCFFDQIQESAAGYLSTSSIHNPDVDGAYANAKYAPLALLLLVECGGRFFYEDIIKGRFGGLEGFEEDSEQLEIWKRQLQKVMDKPEKKTDALSKQIYFPVNQQPSKSKDWHLLSVLASSALAQDIFNKTGSKDFKDKNRKLRDKCRSKSIYSAEQIIDFPNKATLMVTQSSHQNTSILNGKRSGRLFLLAAQPPTWQNQLKPPIYTKSWFDHGVPFHAINEDIQYLSSFLLRFEQLNLSTKGPIKRGWLITWGETILSNVLFYAASIQNLTAGWSSTSGIKLKLEQQYFLDPYRTDIAFQNAKAASDWQNVVASDFAQWLNKKIHGANKQFTPQAEHTKLWKELVIIQLREQHQMVKAVLAATKEEQA